MKEIYEEDISVLEQKINMLSAQTLYRRILKSLENPLKLQIYNGIMDLNEHIEHVDDRLDFCYTQKAVMWKLFALTLTIDNGLVQVLYLYDHILLKRFM